MSLKKTSTYKILYFFCTMKLSNLKNLAADSFIYGISGMLLKLISFILFPIFAQYFTPSSYGIIGVIISLNLLLSTLSGLGLEAASSRWFYDKEDPLYRNKIFTTWFAGRLFGTMLLSLLVYFLLKNWLLNNHLKTDDGSRLILILLASLFLNIIPTQLNYYFVLNKKATHSLVFSLSLALLSSLFCLAFIFFLNLDIVGFFLGQLVAFALASLYGFAFYKRKIKTFQFDFQLFKEMVRYGTKVLPATLSNNFAFFFAILIIQSLTSQHELGIFQVAYTLATGITFFTGGFSQAFIPHALSIEESYFKKFCIWSFDVYCSVLVFICFLLGIFYNEIVLILLSNKYAECVVIAGILTFSHFIISLNTIASMSMTKAKKVSSFGIVILVANLIQLFLLYFLTESNGIKGAAFSFLIINFLSVSVIFYLSYHILEIQYRYAKNLLIIITFFGGYFLINHFISSFSNPLFIKFLFAIAGSIIIILFNFNSLKQLVATLKKSLSKPRMIS